MGYRTRLTSIRQSSVDVMTRRVVSGLMNAFLEVFRAATVASLDSGLGWLGYGCS